MVNEIRIETGLARDRHVSDRTLLARLDMSDDKMIVSIGCDRLHPFSFEFAMWEHTVYELENLAAALQFVALGKLPENYPMASPDVLIGPTIHLCPSVNVEVGHPGIGSEGQSAVFYCSALDSRVAKRRLILLDVISNNHGGQLRMEIDDALNLSEELFHVARVLAARFVGNV